MNDELKEALQQLRQAVKDEGPKPRFHREVEMRHRRQWPTLWSAIDRLLAIERQIDA